VEIDMIGDWLSAGATAVGVGSSLVDRTGALDGLAARARRAVEAVRGVSGHGVSGHGGTT
jgi:2-keto-3-deoxy-6-phosphogluconate aldolase